MRISDWSSDVCSSDLLRHRLAQQEAARRASPQTGGGCEARPSQARARDGPVPPPGRGARQRLLAPARLYRLARARSLYAPRDRRRGLQGGRSEERREGKECVSTGSSRWSTYNSKNKTHKYQVME